MTAKKLLAGLLAVVMLCGLCACGDDQDKKQTPTTAPLPQGEKETFAETFLTAYMTRDLATRLDMYCYDARGKWIGERIAEHGDLDTFLSVVQKGADEKELGYTINSVDDYFAYYHQFILKDYQNIYGTFTVSATAIKTEKQDAETVAKTIDGVLAAVDEAYMDVDAVKAITEAYTITVEWKVDGELKDYTEHKLVQVVLYNGEWRIASHSI